MSTKLRTGNNIDVVVPNAAVASTTLQNYSARTSRRIDLVIRISYEDDVQQVRGILQDIM